MRLQPVLLACLCGVWLLAVSGCKSNEEAEPQQPTPAAEVETSPKVEEPVEEVEKETTPTPPPEAVPTPVLRSAPDKVRSVEEYLEDARKEINAENYSRKLELMDRAVENLERAVNQAPTGGTNKAPSSR